MFSFVFSSSVDIKDVINTFRSINKIKSAAKIIRQALLQIDFGHQDKFCDAEELKFAWKHTKIPY